MHVAFNNATTRYKNEDFCDQFRLTFFGLHFRDKKYPTTLLLYPFSVLHSAISIPPFFIFFIYQVF